ncbi:hypothetical protein [Actinopolymorpha pittospori]|uniref:Uncharacterized protein n=1 Tax=Actinopolymorpha pittospori TaxID=648752 RepID=A0A927MMI4_9ACTN|nr:hypothetical protein [Actinopolymorpha pittospori]MBE1603410.1 hypothetical protein [Actinopolymorpha pittospori]
MKQSAETLLKTVSEEQLIATLVDRARSEWLQGSLPLVGLSVAS